MALAALAVGAALVVIGAIRLVRQRRWTASQSMPAALDAQARRWRDTAEAALSDDVVEAAEGRELLALERRRRR
jgi:hypothetical protein